MGRNSIIISRTRNLSSLYGLPLFIARCVQQRLDHTSSPFIDRRGLRERDSTEALIRVDQFPTRGGRTCPEVFTSRFFHPATFSPFISDYRFDRDHSRQWKRGEQPSSLPLPFLSANSRSADRRNCSCCASRSKTRGIIELSYSWKRKTLASRGVTGASWTRGIPFVSNRVKVTLSTLRKRKEKL